jgi:hypothetical protein
MLIAPETFVILFILVAMAGSRFYYWTVASSLAYILGIMISTEISKFAGWM